jgi:hypothetical protein
LLECTSSASGGPAIRLHHSSTDIAQDTEYGRLEWYSSDSSPGGVGVSNYIGAYAINAGVRSALTFGVRHDSGVYEAMRINNFGKLLSPDGEAFFGTVDNSGNGAIMERGSNANGDFVRFADGTMQCWSPAITTVVNVTITAAGGFRGVMGAWTYPSAFDTAPNVHVQTRTNGHLTGALQTLSETSAGPNAWCATSTSSLTTIYQATAIGRWY